MMKLFSVFCLCFMFYGTHGAYRCGLSPFEGNEKDTTVEKRIVGGRNSPVRSWPWQVGIFLMGKFTCGGSLVDHRTIITANHCVKTRFKHYYYVKLGDHSHSARESSEILRRVSRIIKYPRYGTRGHDIALLKVNRPIPFSKSVSPVCLPRSRREFPKPGTKCFASGWGRVQHSQRTSIVLKHVAMSIVSHRECKRKNLFITNDDFCAKNLQSHSPCSGDSGGPFVCRVKSGQWVLMGVISRGSRQCNNFIYPVFTKVPNYINWISNYA